MHIRGSAVPQACIQDIFVSSLIPFRSQTFSHSLPNATLAGNKSIVNLLCSRQCFRDRRIYQHLAVFVHSLWWLPHCSSFHVLAGTLPQFFSCWLWDHSCHRHVKLDPYPLALSSLFSFFAMSSALRSSSSTSVCTLDLALDFNSKSGVNTGLLLSRRTM